MEKLENKKNNNKKKPLKLSSTGRLQLRKNLGPYSDKNKGNKKTIQIVLETKTINKKVLLQLNPILEDLLHLELCLHLVLLLQKI